MLMKKCNKIHSLETKKREKHHPIPVALLPVTHKYGLYVTLIHVSPPFISWTFHIKHPLYPTICILWLSLEISSLFLMHRSLSVPHIS